MYFSFLYSLFVCSYLGIILIIFASTFVMNLTLAVISDEFNIEDEAPPPAEELITVKKRRNDIQSNEKGKKTIRNPKLFNLVSHPIFSGFIMIVIFVNTAVLASVHHPMPEGLDTKLEIINFALSCIFLIEMILKLFGLGLREYSRDRFNVFDAFVVSMSVLETIATPPSFMTSQTTSRKGAVSALRSFRLFRLFKLARNWKSLRDLLSMVIRAIVSMSNFGVLLFLFIYIYALIGIQVRLFMFVFQM